MICRKIFILVRHPADIEGLTQASAGSVGSTSGFFYGITR